MLDHIASSHNPIGNWTNNCILNGGTVVVPLLNLRIFITTYLNKLWVTNSGQNPGSSSKNLSQLNRVWLLLRSLITSISGKTKTNKQTNKTYLHHLHSSYFYKTAQKRSIPSRSSVKNLTARLKSKESCKMKLRNL